MEKIKISIQRIGYYSHNSKKIKKYAEQLKQRKWTHVILRNENFAKVHHFSEVMRLFRISPELHSKLTFFETTNGVLHKNLNLFLATQKDSLKVVKINSSMDVECLKIIFSMPRLEKLLLGKFNITDLKIAAEGMQKKYSVTHLHLTDDRNENQAVKILLTAFPNVEYLRLCKVDDKIATSISDNGKSLKRLSVKNFYARKISNEAFYLNLEKINCYYMYVMTQYSQELKIKVLKGNQWRHQEYF